MLDDWTSDGFFGVEAILPAQFWSSGARRERGEPERRLMLAVLQDALVTLVVHTRRPTKASRRILEEVRRWFASDARAHPFAFGAICDVLGLDVSYIRGAIRRLQSPEAPAPYRRSYAGRGRHLVERPPERGRR